MKCECRIHTRSNNPHRRPCRQLATATVAFDGVQARFCAACSAAIQDVLANMQNFHSVNEWTVAPLV